MGSGVELQSRQSGQESRRAFSSFSGTAATFKLNLRDITQHHERNTGPSGIPAVFTFTARVTVSPNRNHQRRWFPKNYAGLLERQGQVDSENSKQNDYTWWLGWMRTTMTCQPSTATSSLLHSSDPIQTSSEWGCDSRLKIGRAIPSHKPFKSSVSHCSVSSFQSLRTN